ncbi:hypothetical protein [Desulfofarcimen acetoxidans]|uniref:hypothetical protein n=1 Tax=Desulfofarcimen acetoxidans TaxID=58138 RepID=UPI0012FEE634|nr:hypothetical protein [Desulfofarcimen acetoxidans]
MDDFTIQNITGEVVWENGTFGTLNEELDQTNCYEIDSEAGFCFDIDLLAEALEQYGWGRADVYHRTNESGSASVCIDYWHKRNFTWYSFCNNWFSGNYTIYHNKLGSRR